MRRLLFVLVALPVLALADEGAEQLRLRVGESRALVLGGAVTVGVCDDTTLVKVEDVD